MLDFLMSLWDAANASVVVGGTYTCDLGIGSILGLGASLLGSSMQADATSNAADQAAAGTAEANALQKYQYDTTRADNAPWRAAGESALTNLMGILQGAGKYSSAQFKASDLQNDPGYKFQQEQGMRGVNNMADSFGIGGASLKAAARFNQGLADTSYQNAFNRFQTERNNTLDPLFRAAGFGSNVNAQNQVAGQNYANQVGGNAMDLAALQGGLGMARGNIYGNALNSGVAALGRIKPNNMAYPELGTNPYGTGYQYDSPFDLYPGP